MEQIRCINKRTNKIQYYSKYLVNNAYWRKQTQVEPAPLPVGEQPEQIPVSKPDELHATPAKRKGGRPKKNQHPA